MLLCETRKETGSLFRILGFTHVPFCIGQAALGTWLFWEACVWTQRVRVGGRTSAGSYPIFLFPRENALSCDRGGLAGACALAAQGTRGRGWSNCLLSFTGRRAPSGLDSVPVNRIQTKAVLWSYWLIHLDQPCDCKAGWVTGPKCLPTLCVSRAWEETGKENTKTGQTTGS